MRASIFGLGMVLASSLAQSAAAQNPPLPDSLKDPKAQVSYTIGLNLGAGLRRDDVAVDPGLLAQGLKDGLAGGKGLMTQDQMRAALVQLQTDVQARRAEKASHAADDNKIEGAAFLKANAAKPGVVTLPSGLQYQVLTAGTGAKPTADDVVLCNYRGALLNGTEFDSSYKRGAPNSFPVGGVIRGWTEALQRMPVGSKWRLFVPSDLAYGEKGAGGDIPPNAVLTFEVELISIQPKS